MSEQAKQTKPLIPAVAYLRKSTAGEDSKGRERQEKSIPQQRREITRFAEERGYEIVGEYEDAGKSGWKRGNARPGFAKMLSDAKEKGSFQAIICDDFDRFSRADYDEAYSDMTELRKAGVRYIDTVAQGLFDLGRGAHDIVEIIKCAAIACGTNEYVRRHSRRIALARSERARNGKRSGGNAPYGMKSDGRDKEGRFKGGLVPGDPAQVKIVRRIFHEYALECKAMGAIAGGLNRDQIPTPTKRGRDIARSCGWEFLSGGGLGLDTVDESHSLNDVG